jgi:DASH complex subunit DAD3
VYTLLKASVYSIVLQQQIINDGEVAAGAGGAGGAGGDGGYGYQHEESGMQGGDENTIMR